MKSVGHWIGGRRVEGTAARRGPVFDPARGVQTREVAFASSAEVDAAVKVAVAAAEEWRDSPLSRRSAAMFRLRQLVDARRDDLAALITAEHGKVLDDARGEVARGLDCVEFACGIPHLLKGAHARP
jgi:malonate-semialdehyde dehydrogenase (acetylating) / methylmalonate-semialdehyde dehydrogenase